MKERITITLDEQLISDIDRLVDGKNIKNRSHAIELFLYKQIGTNRPKKAVFLLGGEGTEFRPITYELPKVLLPVQGKTVPEHLIDLFRKYKITELIFSVGYKAKQIREYFGDGSKYGVKITYVEEQEPLGSGGAIKLASPVLDHPFIVTNGDELKDINLDDMYLFHKENKALVTIALTTVSDPTGYGVAHLQGNRIIEFTEKPDSASSHLINSGLSIWEPEALNYIPEGVAKYEKHVFPILARKERLFGYHFSGQWFNTDTPVRYEHAIKEWKGL